MRIPIRLGGHTAPWRFAGADQLGEWIDDRPWDERSEVRVLRVADPRSAGTILDAVRHAVAGSDQGVSGVRCHTLSPEPLAARGFAHALANRLGISVPTERYALHEALARRLANRPVVCLVEPLPEDRPDVLGDSVNSIDLLEKLTPGVRVCAFFTDTPARPLTGTAFDLTVGAPVIGAEFLAQPRDRLWGAYVHIRLAWEAAGDPARARDLADGVFNGLLAEDDVGLERGLNRHADESLAILDEATADALARCLPDPATRTLGSRRGDLLLRAARLLWAPGERGESVPCPWVARAMLRAMPRVSAREFLRGCVTCAPIARDLFTACLQLEVQERGRLIDPAQRPQRSDPLDHFARFESADSFTYRMYPRGCPVAPADPWAFASLGDVVNQFSRGTPLRDASYRLVELRNHLAHCHYVGWAAVNELVEIRHLLQ